LRKTQIFLQNTVPNVLVRSNKHAKIVSLDDREFLTSREEFRKAKVATLKKAIVRTFEEIL